MSRNPLFILMIMAFVLGGCAHMFDITPMKPGDNSAYEARLRKMYENGSISKEQYQNWMYQKGISAPSNIISPDGKTTQWERDQKIKRGEMQTADSDDSLRIYLQGVYGNNWKDEYRRRTGRSAGY